MDTIDKIYTLLKSIKLAISLGCILLLVCIIGGILPQGATYQIYFDLYGKHIAEFITEHHLDSIFSSRLFLFPATVFLINLSLCTISRFSKQLQLKKGQRFGPDIMHIGLLIFGIGAIISASTRTEQLIQVDEGKEVLLKNGLSLHLKESTQKNYKDGRPSEWVALFSLSKDTINLKENAKTMVNHPFLFNGSKYYLQAYSEKKILEIESNDGSGAKWHLHPGESIENKKESIVFMMSNDKNTIAHIVLKTGNSKKVLEAKIGDIYTGYRISAIKNIHSSVINVVNDQGYTFVLIGLLIAGIGVLWIYIQKIKQPQFSSLQNKQH